MKPFEMNWPVCDVDLLTDVERALRSTRWTLSGQSEVLPYFSSLFSRRWADYIGTKHAIPCTSGTAALSIALEAIGILPGDEVIVPGMTWVAVAQVVYNLGAIPILTDINPLTGQIAEKAIRENITQNTKAIILVHAYCGMADVKKIGAIADKYGLKVIEDCSQSHGATWKSKKAGSFFDISVFSTQQSKLLTSGEGGVIATSSDDYYSKIQNLMMDGRARNNNVNPRNLMVISGDGEVQGRNYNITEMQCAILLNGLKRLDNENENRRLNAIILNYYLRKSGICNILRVDENVDQRVYWRCVIDFNCEIKNEQAQIISNHFSERYRIPFEKLDRPLNNNPLYQPHRVDRNKYYSHFERLNSMNYSLPGAENFFNRTMAFPHQVLLQPKDWIVDFAKEINKVVHQCQIGL
ncbi:DegT/DnrJ/EryC1/StrS family aminotransferase [Xenorhabdus stockiae]|uniref:DegT/DnrJ/EryC1/StrS family aminotransferase n=1 Tax=Xenorhabdus stockiae TaxID=351614 RepID=UPI004062DD90